jgi:hypothetical protein
MMMIPGIGNIHCKAFMATNFNKMFSGYQLCHLIKNYRRFGNHLCPHHQGYDIRNDNGVRVGNFATLKNLIVQSTMFQHRNTHKHTLTSSVEMHNQTDHILTDKCTVQYSLEMLHPWK